MKIMELDKYEVGIITNALILLRNQQIEEEKPTDPVDEIIIKLVEAPEKKRPFLKILTRDKYAREI